MRLLLVAAGLALLVGCSGNRCERIEDDAKAFVLDVVDEDQSCTQDSDCAVVAINGSCYDVCTRVVAVANVAAVEAANDEADREICGDFSLCTTIRPPCAAPAAPVCNDDGQCE